MQANPNSFLTIREVAELLKLSQSSVYQLIEAGRLAHHRIGQGRGAIRVLEADLQSYLDQCRQGIAEKPAKLRAPRTKLKHLRL